MICPSCGKESHNIRVCAFCQTAFPKDDAGRNAAPRQTRATAAWHSEAMARRQRTMLWGAVGLLAVIVMGYMFFTRERTIPVGVAVPNLVTIPMSDAAAAGTIRTVNAVAKVEVEGSELTVRLTVGLFPARRDGKLAFAQQYARADEIVLGRKRAITFMDAEGKVFAKADPEKGVTMTR